jgi:quercetin dioxygenase-like cupin family protein
MTEPQLIDPATIAEASDHPVAHCRATGGLRARFNHPEGFSQWIVTADLEEGTTITWGTNHGDEAVYVIEGELSVGKDSAVPGGVVIVESNTPFELLAGSDSRIIHIGTDVEALGDDRPLGIAAAVGHGVHLLGPGGIPSLKGDGTTKSKVSYFANGKCPSCRMMLYRVSSEGDTRSHTHTQPQLQHVLKGDIRIGPFQVSAGMTFAVPAGYRYSYRSEGEWELLVHRPDLSMIRYKPDDALMDEGGDYTQAPPWASAS